jgi:hypothetical protein
MNPDLQDFLEACLAAAAVFAVSLLIPPLPGF